jgi:alpha-beta hydrolase superfamily lysophospholipase
VSSDAGGRRIVVTGAVLTPRKQSATEPRVVAWGHGTEGLADACAPSRSPSLSSDPTFDLYATEVGSLLDRGWTVAASDYPGLGSPGPHPYLVGESEGRAIIDSVRAARNLSPRLSRDWVAVGHSQGGQGALFAGEQANAYGTGLRLRGVVGVAAAADLDQLAQGIAGTPGQGYLVMALYGLAAVDHRIRPRDYLTPTALSRVGVLRTGCFTDIMAAYQDLSADQLLLGGSLPADIIAAFALSNPGQRPAGAPVLLLSGEADETVPTFVAQDLLTAYCAQGTPTSLQTYPGATHDTIVTDSAMDAARWIEDRFAGIPATDDCPRVRS